MAPPLNPDLPSTYAVPGVYGAISTQGSGPVGPNRRVLFLSYKTSAGIAQAAVPVRVNSEDDAVSYAGKGSDLVRMYRAFNSHGGTGAEVWFCPMAAPSGTAQTRKVTILARPSDATTLGVNTSAQAAGFVTVMIAGYRADAIIANGDTFSTIASSLHTELLKIEDQLPCTVSISTATLTFTARHAALTSADFPITVTFSSTSMGVAASPGTLTLASTASGAGSVTLYCATQSASGSISNTDTASTIARALSTGINAANAFPLTSCNPSGAVITLFYVADRVCNWLATAITTAITTTMTPAWGSDAAGLPSSSSPSLANALTNIGSVASAQGAFRVWVTNFTGAGSFITDAAYDQAGSTTSYAAMGTISSFIEAQGNGLNCKGQVVIFGDSRSLAVAGALPVGTTPALTASPRYFPDWVPACPQQAYEIAARDAAMVIAEDFMPRNYAGSVLRTDGKVPLIGVHPAVSMSDSDANSAMMSYYMAPVRMNAFGQYTIVSGRTSAKPSATMDVRYAWRGQILTCDYMRDDYISYMAGIIKGKSIKRYSAPSTTNTISPEAIRDLTTARMMEWDDMDFFDGAAALKDFVQSSVNVVNPARVDVSLPIRVPAPLEQLSALFFTMA